MHATSFNEMSSVLRRYLDAYTDRKLNVVDIGSKVVGDSRSYRQLMPHTWDYIGIDMEKGDNVDLVMEDSYKIPINNGSVNVVLSGQCLEHVARPWLLVKEIARILDPGGHCFLTTPAKMHLHAYPQDYWRILPEGMRVLLEDAGFEAKEVYTIPVDGLIDKYYGNPWTVDCWGIGIKTGY